MRNGGVEVDDVQETGARLSETALGVIGDAECEFNGSAAVELTVGLFEKGGRFAELTQPEQ